MAPRRPDTSRPATKKLPARTARKAPNKVTKKSPKKSPTRVEFPDFNFLPNEIQSKIFTEALCKPHVHFVRASEYERPFTGRWGVRFNRFQGVDYSGFRLLAQISKVSPVAANAVRLATAEKARLPYTEKTKTIGNIDASTDIVCVQFGNARNNWRPTSWARENQHSWLKKFDREDSLVRNRGIRKVAIIYNQGTTKQTPDLHGVFRCHIFEHRMHGCKVCPNEVMGFMDTFPDLEGIYIIIRQGSEKIAKETARVYKNSFFSLPKHEREEKNLEVYHDMRRTYLEVIPQMVQNIHPRVEPEKSPPSLEDRIGMVFQLIQDMRTGFNRPEPMEQNAPRQYTMDLEKRQKLKITALLETDRV